MISYKKQTPLQAQKESKMCCRSCAPKVRAASDRSKMKLRVPKKVERAHYSAVR